MFQSYKSLIRGFISCSLLLSPLVFAGTMGEVAIFDPTAYIQLGSGGSYSMKANIYANPVDWDAAPQGYNAPIGSSALYSAAFGYRLSPLFSSDIEYVYRPSFSYARYQTPPKKNAILFVGDVTRHFSLESNSLMGNLYVHGSGVSDALVYNLMNDYYLEPFIGGGLGVSFNTMANFKSLKPVGLYVSYALASFRTAFSGQASAGLRMYSKSKSSLEVGYRYYNGGSFTSQDFVLDGANVLTPWKGTVQSNEFFIRLAYAL